MVETRVFRQQLLSFAIEFIQTVMNLNGITRIAMFGSLTTNKPDPKDADLLITVKNDLDLSRLAKAGRRLQGRAQSLNRGGEVFLANRRRLYLHDDFGAIQLSDERVKFPPIEIWPNYKARVEVPKDLADALTKVLG